MKNLLLCSVVFFLLISCSTDSDPISPELNSNNSLKPIDTLGPENKSNPFDYHGKQYYDAITSYEKEHQYPSSIREIADQIRFVSTKFGKGNHTGKNIIPFTDEIVESIMADPDNSMILIVQNSLLSASAKSSLINFLQGLIVQRNLEFSVTYDYIISYEDTIIDNGTFNDDDLDTILTVTSISRYSLYSESQRKDRDWEKTAGNKFAKSMFSENEASIISIISLLERIL